MPTYNQHHAAFEAASEAETLEPESMPRPVLIGATLDDRYYIEGELGRGGIGAVYLAHDRKLHDKLVVVKVLLEKSLQNPWVATKFQQEKEALSRVDHPGVIGILDTGELSDSKPYIVMQYVDGVSLRDAIKEKPEGMDLERVALVIKQAGAALSAVHEKKIYHRDLKPENVMLQRLGRGEQVKIVDFGIAKVKESVVAPSTVTGVATAGTIIYMSPEQLRGEKVSAPSDIYSLGVIAYELVTGRRPFNPETIAHFVEMQREGVRVKPADLRPRLPGEAERLILKALSFEVKARPQNAAEFGDALSRALMNEGETLKLDRAAPAEIPPTQPAISPQPPDQLSRTMPAQFEPAQVITPPSDLSASMPAPSRFSVWINTPWLKFAVSFVFLVAVVTVFYGVFTLRSSTVPNASSTGSSNRSGVPPSDATAERSVVYSLTVQKFHNGASYDQAFETSGQEIFENGWKFKMNISSPQVGYLYLLNEGPAAGDAVTYNVLFPESKTNNGSPRVFADQKLQTAWMRFDEHQGTEKFWLVWSASPVKELDAVTNSVNEKDQGEIKDSAQARAVRNFLDKHSSPKPDVAKDSAKKQTTVKGKGEVLVNYIELEHH